MSRRRRSTQKGFGIVPVSTPTPEPSIPIQKVSRRRAARTIPTEIPKGATCRTCIIYYHFPNKHTPEIVKTCSGKINDSACEKWQIAESIRCREHGYWTTWFSCNDRKNDRICNKCLEGEIIRHCKKGVGESNFIQGRSSEG